MLRFEATGKLIISCSNVYLPRPDELPMSQQFAYSELGAEASLRRNRTRWCFVLREKISMPMFV